MNYIYTGCGDTYVLYDVSTLLAFEIDRILYIPRKIFRPKSKKIFRPKKVNPP